MKRKEKAAVDEFVALVGGKTWEPVRHKCMGKWSGMTDYGFVIDGRITLFVSNSMAYFKKRIREWIKSIHTFEAKKDCYLRLLREQIEIIGSERGSHRNGNENPSSRQAGHCGRKRNFIPIFWFRGYQRSVEYRYGQAHRW